MTPRTWSCPICGRRVPGSLEVCRCGTARIFSEAMPSQVPAARIAIGPLPWEVKTALGAGVLLLVLGIVYVALHHE